MNNEEILGHLLQIEAEAAALVDDAQAEADRRVDEGEKRNRAAFEERYQAEAARLETDLFAEKEKIKGQYQQELASYREQLNAMSADMDRFAASLETALAESEGGAV